MRSIVGLWRWRENPLRRGTDLMEAWVSLLAALLFALATPATGWLCGALIDSSLQHTIRQQRVERHRTSALVTALPREQHQQAFDAEAVAGGNGGNGVIATWSAANGGSHTGTLTAPGRHVKLGDTFGIWVDRAGKPVKGPMDATAARFNAAMAGAGTTILAAVLVEALRRLIVWRIVRRRYNRLDRAWAEAGPDWGRTGAGS